MTTQRNRPKKLCMTNASMYYNLDTAPSPGVSIVKKIKMEFIRFSRLHILLHYKQLPSALFGGLNYLFYKRGKFFILRINYYFTSNFSDRQNHT